ncbi:MAG: ABC transporter substrate-binding protein [Pseudomonadota bacterium]
MWPRVAKCLASLLLAFSAIAAQASTQCQGEGLDTSRVVVAGGSITEVLYDLGLESRIVAVDRTSNYPAAARDFPSIGYVRALSAEGVLSVGPTLIIGEDDTGPPEVVKQLVAADIDIRIVPEQHDADGIIAKVRCVAELFDVTETADAFVRETLQPRVETLAAIQATRSMRGAVLLGIRDGSIIAAGADTSGHGLLSMMGADNALQSLNGWKPVSMEAMIAARPDFVVIPERGLRDAGGEDKLLEHPALRFSAVAKHRRILTMDGMAMLGFGPRTLVAAERLALRLSESQASETDMAP